MPCTVRVFAVAILLIRVALVTATIIPLLCNERVLICVVPVPVVDIDDFTAIEDIFIDDISIWYDRVFDAITEVFARIDDIVNEPD